MMCSKFYPWHQDPGCSQCGHLESEHPVPMPNSLVVKKVQAYVSMSCCEYADAVGVLCGAHPSPPARKRTLRDKIADVWFDARDYLALMIAPWRNDDE